MGGRCSAPGEAGVLKRGANLSVVKKLSSLAVKEAGHPSEASQLPCCCSKELPDVCLVSQLAVKGDSQRQMSCSDLDTTSSCVFCGLRPQSSRRRSMVLKQAVTACSSPGEKGSDRVTSSAYARALRTRFNISLM
ncbi:hypothetical protein E2C01_079311 [Portunus trituberculatus]|uniref:Uncharacterized protein n=1 Tax=Portunus trituberculatus TaxID=210409 RepID=A0A5B7IJ78_PORTR|nr:hypothetical protein [Portunus trituberculatus]